MQADSVMVTVMHSMPNTARVATTKPELQLSQRKKKLHTASAATPHQPTTATYLLHFCMIPGSGMCSQQKTIHHIV